MSGLDRPVSESKYCPRFFGRPAALPVLHVPLALKANVPVVVVGAIRQPNGVYQVQTSEPIFMRRHPDRYTEIMQNAETILDVASGYIRKAPQQWAMFYPVWPDALIETP